jgi:predicted CoA-binding protein
MAADDIDALLDVETVAVVGLKDDPNTDGYDVSAYMQRNGYRIIPVNPYMTEVLGEQAYPDLASVPGDIDLVNVFRPSEFLGDIIDQAVARGVKKGVWGQLDIVDEAGAARARKAGLRVVMDRCLMVEHRRRRR